MCGKVGDLQSGGLHFSGYGFEIWEISTDVLCLTKRTFSFLFFLFSGPDGTGVYECFSDVKGICFPDFSDPGPFLYE